MNKYILTILFVLNINSTKAALDFTYPSPLCGTLTDSFTNTSVGAYFAYGWNFGDPVTGTGNFAYSTTVNTEYHTFSTYGTFTVKLYAFDASNQILDSIEHIVKLIQAPLLFILPNSFQDYCYGMDTINTFVTATNDPAYKYTWTPLPKSYVSSNHNSVEYRFTNTTTFTVIVTDTVTGCSKSLSKTIKFNNCTPVTSQFTYVPPQCGVLNINFTNTSLSSHHYKWYFGDPASGINDTLSKSDSSSVSHIFSDTGTYYVSLVAYDSLETKMDSVTRQVKLYRQSLAKIFNNDTSQCKGSNTTLTGMGIGTATWSPSQDLSTTTGYSTIASPQNTTTYYLTTDNNGCIAVDSIIITVQTKPDPGFVTDTLCIDESYIFNANTPGNTYYHWDFGNGDTAFGQSVIYSFDTSGIYNVKLLVSNGVCDSFTTVQAVVLNNPIAAFLPDKLKEEVTKASFQFTNQSNHAFSYLWDFGDLNSSTQVSPEHTYIDTGWFKVMLTAYNNIGCEDTFSIMIRVDEVYKYFVPSAFTPNRSGPFENEVFKPFGPKGTTKFEMIIYDRWGHEIFTSSDEKIPWDGKYQDGFDCPIGNYIYVIRFKDPTGKRLLFKGIVTLCR